MMIQPRTSGVKERKMKEYRPDFEITCPGGIGADFLERRDSLLRWRGYLPPTSGSLSARCVAYTFYTDAEGHDVEAPGKYKESDKLENDALNGLLG